MMKIKNIKPIILGIKLDDLSLDEILNKVNHFINYQKEKPLLIITFNPEMGTLALKDENFKKILQDENFLKIIDGIGIIFAARFLGIKIKNRTPGIDVAYKILEEANIKGYSVSLIGSREENLIKAQEKLLIEFPDLKLIETFSGYFNEEKEQKIVETIKKSNTDILFVAMGAGLQEKWMYKWKDKLNVKCFIGIGGAFDVWAGSTKRAPLIFQKTGFEWLYRLIKEPKRFARLTKSFSFYKEVFFEKIRVKK